MRVLKAQPGEVFDKWVVLSEGPRTENGSRRVWCRCSCGRERLIHTNMLGSGKGKACMHCANTKHGVTRKGHVPDEYSIWKNMIDRCTNPHNKSYKNYGARGISVCDAWLKDVRAFIADAGPRPSRGYTLDRINNDGNYEPGNIRWATRLEQARNRRPRSHGRSLDAREASGK